MKTLAASLSILTREGVMLYLLRGVAFTWAFIPQRPASSTMPAKS